MQSCAAPSTGYQAALGAIFQGFHRAGEQGMGVGQVKMPQKLLCLTDIQLLFLNKFCLDCSKSLVDFQSSERNSFYIKKKICFGGAHFQRFLLCHFMVMSLSLGFDNRT